MEARTRQLWRVTLACWLILAGAVAVRNYLKPYSHTVYPVFVEGGRHWLAGQSLYREYEGLDRFRYSPSFAVMMTPFAGLDDRLGSMLWSWLCLAVYYLGLRKLAVEVLAWPEDSQSIFLILALLGGLSGLWNGQSNALLIGLVLWGCAALVGKRWWQTAACWSAAVLVKLPLLAVVLLFTTLFPRTLMPRLAACLLAGLALPLLTRAPGQVGLAYQEWLTQLAETSTHRWPGFRDAWLVWELWQAPVPLPAYRAMQLAAAGLAWLGCLAVRRRQAPLREQVLAVLGLGVAWLMVFGPATEFATYVWLAPLVSWAVLEAWRQGRGRVLAGSAYLLTMVIGCGHFDAWFAGWHPLLLPGGTLLFVCWLVHETDTISGGLLTRNRKRLVLRSATRPLAGGGAIVHGST